MHIAKAGSFRLWFYDWFGGRLRAYCGVDISEWNSGSEGSPVCEKCGWKAGWQYEGDGVWTIPWSGTVIDP